MFAIMKQIYTKQNYKKHQSLLPIAKTLRNKQTPHEEKLWQKIKGKKLLNIQFYRQKILLNNYIVDFYAPKIKLVIEVDGVQHTFEEHAVNYKVRDEQLNALDITVKRYSNIMVSKDINYVMNDLYHCMCNLLRI